MMRQMAALAVVLALFSAGATCKRGKSRAEANEEFYKPPRPDDMPAADMQRSAADTAHPRIVLTADKIERIKAHASARSELWVVNETYCELALQKDLSAGYLGAYWGRALAGLTFCWYGTGDDRYVNGAIRYLKALLDDKARVGDGQGGELIVRGNRGFPIRNHGLFVALAYDWLYHAPGMTDELRAHMVERLGKWLAWYAEDGYLNDSPFSNYFWGYMSTLTIAALAVQGEADVAEAWMTSARDKLENLVLPGFWSLLKGGEWTEGWQYGQFVALEVSLVVNGFRTATGNDMSKSIPWLSELVDSRVYELRPDKRSVYGNGTHEKNPAEPASEALYGALLLLEHTDPDKAAEARYLIHEDFPKIRREYAWFGLLADTPDGMPRKDPRVGRTLSYHLPGPGLTLARSSWGEDASWVSFQAGPRVSIDHQNADQGHFEMWRGSDGLVIDGGAAHSQATINHNTILVDDDRKILRYSPSQGVWGKKVKTTHFYDDGEVVVAVGDLADAWSPKCVIQDCDERGVDKAVRTLVYVRPGVVAVDDRVTVTESDTWVAWAAHVRQQPSIQGSEISSRWGQSRVDITRLLPDKATIEAPKEPTLKVDHPFRDNRPAFDLWRLQTVTEKGARDRHMRHVLVMADQAAPAAFARPIAGAGASGGVVNADGKTIAVGFADATSGGTLELPASGADLVIMIGLEPKKKYDGRVEAGTSCSITIAPSEAGKLVANDGGFVRLAAPQCQQSP